jgi:hypothetical protein
MTVATELNEVTRAWTGVETVFSTGIPAIGAADVRVTYETISGVVTLTRGVHYTSRLVPANSRTAAPLEILPLNMPPAPLTLLISRVTPSLQPVDLSSGHFDPDVIERQLDADALRDAEQRSSLDRAVRVLPGQTPPVLDKTPFLGVGGQLGLDAAGNFIFVPTGTPGATIVRTQITDSTPVGRSILGAATGTDVLSIIGARSSIEGFATRTLLKAADTSIVKRAYLTEADREGEFVWRTGDFTAQLASDTFEGIYIKADAVAISAGCWVRVMREQRFEMDWFGARTAVDVLPIWNKVKLLAAGATLAFGPYTYTTSGTLGYEAAANKPIWITGVSAELTRINNQGTGFTFEYYGLTGSGNEVRGGGIYRLSLGKSGAGTCSGVDIANAYRGQVRWCDTSACGNIGIRITGRGAGDTDATAGFVIAQNRCRDGIVGIQVRALLAGAIVAAEIEIRDNNCEGNATTGIWLANCDKVRVWSNTITLCGDTNAGAVNGRGCLWVEYNGITAKNIDCGLNEIGNMTAGSNYMLFVDSVANMTMKKDRWIRNDADVGLGAILFANADHPGAVIRGVKIEEPFINAGTLNSLVFCSFGAGTQTFANRIQIIDPDLNQWTEGLHILSGNTSRTIVLVEGEDIRIKKPAAGVTASGAINISSNVTLTHQVTVNATGGSTINISGEAKEGDMLFLEIHNTSGAATTVTPSAGFVCPPPPNGNGLRHATTLRYSTVSGAFRQVAAWVSL